MAVWKTVTEESPPLVHMWRVSVTPQITEGLESLNRDLIPKVTDLIPKVISSADAVGSWTTKAVLGTIFVCSIVTALSSAATAAFLWKSRRDEKQKEDKKIPKSRRDEKQEEDDDIRTSDL